MVWPRTQMEIDAPEEAILHGIDISTSEVGLVTPSIETLLYQLICTNGLKGIRGNQDAVRWRYFNVQHEQIVEKLTTYILATEQRYYKEQEMLRKATKKMLSAQFAEKLFSETLRRSSVAGTLKQQEFYLGEFKAEKKIGNGKPAYTLYQTISALTRIARDLYASGDPNKSSRLERESGRLLTYLDEDSIMMN